MTKLYTSDGQIAARIATSDEYRQGLFTYQNHLWFAVIAADSMLNPFTQDDLVACVKQIWHITLDEADEAVRHNMSHLIDYGLDVVL